LIQITCSNVQFWLDRDLASLAEVRQLIPQDQTFSTRTSAFASVPTALLLTADVDGASGVRGR